MNTTIRHGFATSSRASALAAFAVATIVSAGSAGAETLSDATFTLTYTPFGSISQGTLNGVNLDSIPMFLAGTCSGLSGPSVPVVSGTVSTWTATCGSFDVAVTMRLISPLPSMPGSSGGWEQEFTFINGTAGALPLTAVMNIDTDLMGTTTDDTAAYDASAKAVFAYDTNASPDTLLAVIASSDQVGSTFGWDVDILGSHSTSFPMDNGVGPVGPPSDIAMSIGHFANVPAGDSATVKFRGLYARGVTTVPTDFDFSSCYSSPVAGCRAGTKSGFQIKDNADNTKDKLLWKLSGAAATTQTELSVPTSDADYTLCAYDGTEQHLGGFHVAASASKWLVVGDKGYKYTDKDGTSDGIQKVLAKGSDDAKTKLLVKGSGSNLSPPGLGALTLPITVQVHNGGQPGICFEADYAAALTNDIDQLKCKTP